MHSEPTLVIGLRNITSIAAGNDFLLALSDSNEVHRMGVFPWDANVGEIDWFRTHPWNELWPHNRPHSTRPKMIAIYATPLAAFGVDSKGILWSWGDNTNQKLGHADDKEPRYPQKVRDMNSHRTKLVIGNTKITLAVTKNGSAFVWGDLENAFPLADPDQLPPHIELEKSPDGQMIIVRPAKLLIPNITGAAVGDEHMVIVTEEGDLYTWGSNKNGQCGLGWSRTSLSVPYELKIKNTNDRPVKWVSASGTWTFFGVVVEGAGRGILHATPKINGDAMELD
jgi:alpha-tubulin suppressor-like RCC1 family protein